METKLLIFDLDGTLADTLDTIRAAVNMCMEHFEYPLQSREQVRANIGSGVTVLLKKSLPANVPQDKFEEIRNYFTVCYRLTHDKIDSCYDGVYDTVMKLKSRGYKLAVLSNKPDELVKTIIKKLFGDGVFECAVGQTELPTKPNPTVPLLIAAQYGVKPCNCWFIGDSDVDVQTGKNAGMHTVAVSWGFRDISLLEGAEFIAQDAEELKNYFA